MIKLGVRVTSGLPGLDHPTEGPCEPSRALRDSAPPPASTGSWADADNGLESETTKGKVFFILLTKVKTVVTCKCQDCTLSGYSCLCWEASQGRG